MTPQQELLKKLASKTDTKIVLVVMDGVGGIHTVDSAQTALETANTPNLDALAGRGATGRLIPCEVGVTPGSGPGHLALFGYDPLVPAYEIGRGVLEACGINFPLTPSMVATRGNFCSLGADGTITDRRAGRIPSDEGARICQKLQKAIPRIEDVKIHTRPVKEYRFCTIFDGPGLEPSIEDTDPQKVGLATLPARTTSATAAGKKTQRIVQAFLDQAFKVMADEPKANGLVLRGFAVDPGLPKFQELYKLTPCAIATYPLYRGVASLAGMEVLETGQTIADEVATLKEVWDKFDFFFFHVKKTDSNGEDGNLAGKIKVIEEFDAALPGILEMKPDVIAVTADHCTPYVMKGHSYHPVPLLICGPTCDVDATVAFTESECLRGSLGTFHSEKLMGLLLDNAGKLLKFGS
ncbi:MAG: 2,3-bisphosphoglycerate-independent phosphoglycerate mutase [bacterium]|nr:2,3-bisphosphoglycerate-independent phosphoglycerate mutase [bacterium]